VCEREEEIGLLSIGDKEGGAGTHRNEVLIQDDVRDGVARNIDLYNYSISFIGGGEIKSKKSVLVDRHGIWLIWTSWELI